MLYSPDLNPIEQAFAKLKTLLRKTDPRAIEATWRNIGDALLVAVDVAEIGVALAAVAPGAHRIPFARAFELDDLGTHISEDHRAERAGHVLGQIEHFEPVERASAIEVRSLWISHFLIL